jgi:heme o synthase
MQSIVYAVLMLPVCILPYIIQLTEYKTITGMISFGLVILANIFLVGQCIRLYKEMDVKAARRVMFSSYIYLPVVLLALLASKA